ncbi:hypothetical protein PUN28_010884 [Cardiocondyla obscurior]|uniref:Uncharacterized protein n=1 Tax=Cardiocondyla obscurior TaxID=286306 RepID=A0AAW2FNZ3_9HYME
MPPPYSAKKCKVLQELIKSKSSPIQKWPQYPIRILASAEAKCLAVCGLDGKVTYVHSSSEDSGKIKLNLLI